ncbi:hypothetical protein A3H80_04675 [Candidatus Roizmanbacteria bacterium RIFCSPLOWO2_02_FULL_37_19]|uniref:Type 4a pilus biogenesis protein PilO n=1 Tax=Candidatus Roizmanbacteria bacterium RIFCSPHIGHO2_02_FULL_37_24 TaxID=1802037 RepID=A0A1F7GZN4_9BACT|nr:MAG: hypothetical protein A2862_00115 [Candidatus Roizmanbacteria bacterium RIFCSPHIGHO2_01_FULL_38_41]OGK23996.1 MAG: hypothetical protein A3C24_02810 [Candidatus Roizmanbacteria bacterium RIFCSPHIGHO2_02_FULL_37_24]OGK32390.1 MAG: hypothetical protein A3E10_04380 [Candidatus Roizmanbacteria bacterium RIFCSPHIGHO2_12_FULL_37_23]OGK44250.1 MAG: hypothetical protein A2956_00175 [Candidatus Roizmanbacteria bacterium RIFCSPLOWO2_01_FULL_37_57]OGK54153.1 MAG: hypothetical protein A3H80_04675 [Ca
MVDNIKKNPYLIRIFAIIITLVCVIALSLLLNTERKTTLRTKAELAKATEDLRLLDNLLADYNQNINAIEAVENTVPQSYEDVAFAISQFEQAAAQNGQDLTIVIKDKAHEEQGGLDSVEVVLQTSGSYSNFSNMMSTIAKLPYHTRLDALQIDNTEGGLTHEATLRVYIQEEN